MSISLTNQEYRLLLELLYVADWVLHAHRVSEDTETRPYRDLTQKVLSHANEFEMEDLVAWDEQFDEYFFPQEFDDGPVMYYIEEFEALTFWDELAHRLARRDLAREHDHQPTSEAEIVERMEKLFELEEKYASYFEQHGLERLEIG